MKDKQGGHGRSISWTHAISIILPFTFKYTYTWARKESSCPILNAECWGSFILATKSVGCGALGRLVSLSRPRFPHFLNEHSNNTHLLYLQRTNETMELCPCRGLMHSGGAETC